jgi:hypothetical protein
MFERAARRRLWIGCLAITVLWYPALLWLLGFSPNEKVEFGLAFNSMAEHLLAGRFDVDPLAIGAEGFDIGNRTVAYFGIFCAVLRIPLVLSPGLARVDVTWWSCLLSLWIAVWLQMGTIALVWTADSPRRNWLATGLLISVVLGGQHIQFLRPSIYQETINWASAQSMAFIFLFTRGLVTPRGFDRSTLCLMALCAGLAVLTRVSFGIGLYAAFGLFLLSRARPREWPMPACILLAAIAITGIVNMGRWGSPFTFADYSYFDLSQDANPERLGHLAAYGTFNLARIWLGLDYYFVPIWIWLRSDGHVLFAETQAAMMDAMELPPGSFFVTDPLLLFLAVAGIAAVRDRVRAAPLIGLSAQPLLMLSAISMAHRYRMEFYPLLFLAALYAIAAASTPAATTRRTRGWIIGSVIVGIVASHVMAVVEARSPWGPGEFYLERYGLIGTYFHPRSVAATPPPP